MRYHYMKILAMCILLCLLSSCRSEGAGPLESIDSPELLKEYASYTTETLTQETETDEQEETETIPETKEETVETIPPETEEQLIAQETETEKQETFPSETNPVDTTVPVEETETVPDTEKEAPEKTVETETTKETETPETEASTEIETETDEVETVPAVPAEELLDFTKLKEFNPDIYAWIEIEGTVIDDPILQNAEDDTLYLRESYDRKPSTAGALFTEATYNSTDFNDPVTMIYGHRTKVDNMFGALQPTYADAESFAQHDDIKIYLPGEVRHYTVFAAVPYDSIHILYTYDFSNEYWYNTFFKNVRKIRSIGANFNEDIKPEPGDRVIILSCCLVGDRTQRFLVMAVLQEDLADNQQ